MEVWTGERVACQAKEIPLASRTSNQKGFQGGRNRARQHFLPQLSQHSVSDSAKGWFT